jgi:hypothetical protein
MKSYILIGSSPVSIPTEIKSKQLHADCLLLYSEKDLASLYRTLESAGAFSPSQVLLSLEHPAASIGLGEKEKYHWEMAVMCAIPGSFQGFVDQWQSDPKHGSFPVEE